MGALHARLQGSLGQPVISIDLRGPRLYIRRAQPEDAATSYRWFANPKVTTFLLLAGKGDLPLESIKAYLTRVATSDRPCPQNPLHE